MTNQVTDIYESIAQRTDGNIYIGVVGPVRTGKSTFIKRFMQTQVLPRMESGFRRDRAVDELPQSGSGRTIMTAEPKFVRNNPGRKAIITSLDKCLDALDGKTGTVITFA